MSICILGVKRKDLALSFERTVNLGGLELASWIRARMMLWNDGLDVAVAELLTDAKVRTNMGAFDAMHFSAAVAALNRQTIGGVPLGSSRPIALCGENRRALMHAVPGPARSTGDESAVLSTVVYSASVEPDFLALVHPDHMPAAVSYLGTIEPRVNLGDGNGAPADLGAVVYSHRSAPGLIVDADDKAVGVVRMIA